MSILTERGAGEDRPVGEVHDGNLVEETPALGPVTEVQDPLVPLHAYWPDNPDGWRDRGRELAREARSLDSRILFLGDSITQGWGAEGLAVWEARFAPLKAANMGIGGDRTQQILWRLGDGALEGLCPKVVVLLIGVNNLWKDVHEFGAARVADGVAAVVDAIGRHCPGAVILAIGILPTQADPENPMRAIVREVNALVRERLTTRGDQVRSIDLSAVFLEPDGAISPEIMPDACHLSAQGYARFADALEPWIHDILGDDKV
ncbi:hypothetical protein CCAX7_000060 [Capsulimonas corticalis]|uniref:Uncharacterized protein n=1 Tax=Capsulimonas corticalis TaxID=2219043 RepID=A0A402CRI6_9BACT|nr:GDSL-type esterase/lipase family protein [Capsulimonas corticalis]BDI27955.1 hypothetical protein CCAX7_000060 [Capsulimonas corticalis]